MQEYCTLFQDGSGVYEEKKSKFIGEAHPVGTEEEVLKLLDEARKRYYDARHHCYAYVLGLAEDNVKCSDDGEPQKTAGVPILNVIRGAGLTDVLVIVTRYFGGTLLGTGGLQRAYTKAAALALEDGGVLKKSPAALFRLSSEYTDFGKIRYYCQEAGFLIQDEVYSDKVGYSVPVPLPEEEAFRKKVMDLTAGRTLFTAQKEITLDQRIR
ncbi:MAG: YigZ family protein [Lachnospiraceae bacterium]|nr:YigZ family protein [Lachnospiraceae bacterium]MBR5738679.1 YigZ family protein [Lachnospiraceae bacterium]